MREGELESLLSKAKALEKKYNWLQATKLHVEAAELALNEKDLAKGSEFQEQTGYCFYRAAFQAQTNSEFKKCMKQAIQAYETELQLLREASREENQTRIKHAEALVAYTRSWLQTNPYKKKKLLNEWWTLENQTLSRYERAGDLYSAGKVCNDLMQYSSYHRINLASSKSENDKIRREMISLGEKAIQVFSEVDDDFELARAYCFASIYCTSASDEFTPKFKIGRWRQKRIDYSNKAVELSLKTGNAWLIGWSYISAYNAKARTSGFSKTSLECCERVKEFGAVAKDKFLVARGNACASVTICLGGLMVEDPDKRKEGIEKAKVMAEEAIHDFKIINHLSPTAYYAYIFTLRISSGGETSSKKKNQLLKLAMKASEEGIELFRGWKKLLPTLLSTSAELYGWHLSGTKGNLEEKKEMLRKGIHYRKKAIAYEKQMHTSEGQGAIYPFMHLANLQALLAKIETDNKEKIGILKRAVESAEKSIKEVEKVRKARHGEWFRGSLFPMAYFILSYILRQIYSVTKEKKPLIRAIEASESGIELLESTDLAARIAESYWHLAQYVDLLGDQQKASQKYEAAAQAYDLASKKIPQLKQFYVNYSAYMRAWSQIEQGRYHHSIEDYEKAEANYERAAYLHESSEFWSYLSTNYAAWASMEKAENFSRKENTEQAKQTFQKALKQFNKAKESIKHKLEEITSTNEKEMINTLLKASDLRRKYCQARIRMEDAKLLDREGNYLQSSKSYAEAAENISAIIEKTDAEAERKEFEYLAILCHAWEKMATAEERTSSESYLEAAEYFEQAKDYCYTRKASLWALGNSSFCKGLAAGTRYQDSLNLKENAIAKSQLNRAATMYRQAGFKNASEYAKATQRLFDAYIFMNQAEGETDPEKRAKKYQMAEQLLQIAAGAFTTAKQPEKTAQVQQMLETVREEKALAASLNEVLHAPALTSSTLSFTAPTPTSEASVGLESFEHANVQANLVSGVNKVRVGESFSLTVEFVNAGKEKALLTRVEDFIPEGFTVFEKPRIYRLEDTCLNMKGKQLAPLKLAEARLIVQPSKKGVYKIEPKVHYLDELGQKRSIQPKAIEIEAEEVILSNRVSTGTKELDALLLGGIPENYAVALTGPPSDEREQVIANFLETGEDQTSFYVATEAAGLENLLEKPNFYFFLCNPKPKVEVPDLPNVYKLYSKADINNLNIALLKAYRTVQQSSGKRICVNIVSNVLVNYTVKTTRKWISELTTDLTSKGFTILAVINPLMHTPEELNSILDLFDGEINVTQTDDPLEHKKALTVKKLRNQEYIKNPICLTKPQE